MPQKHPPAKMIVCVAAGRAGAFAATAVSVDVKPKAAKSSPPRSIVLRFILDLPIVHFHFATPWGWGRYRPWPAPRPFHPLRAVVSLPRIRSEAPKGLPQRETSHSGERAPGSAASHG